LSFAEGTEVNRFISRTILWAVLLSLCLAGAAQAATQLDLTLALETALHNNLSLRMAEADFDAARGRVQAAQVRFSQNPELSAGVARRTSPGERSTDMEFSIAQQLELPGKRSNRVAAAEADLAGLTAQVEHLRLEIAREVGVTFTDALLAERMTTFAAESVQLAVQLLEAAMARREAGDITDLEVNLANIRKAQARRSLLRSELRQAEKVAALSRLLALPASEQLMLSGKVTPPREVTSTLASLTAHALAQRKDLESLGHINDAREAETRLARAEARPDIGLSARYEQEAGIDDIAGVGISIKLPIFNRNKGRIAEARAGAVRAHLDVERGNLAVESEVAQAYKRYQAAAAMVDIYDSGILAQVADNLQLLRLSFEAGKIGLLQLIPVQQELLDTRREYLGSIGELHHARAALEIAVGGNLK
jgi:cobalt-zinc-cadmium efflux system outer membrane protein